MKSLVEINTYWSTHCQCSLKKSATQAVFGSGNPQADIVLIGEAPGKNEDLQGVPFVGSGGKLLDEMLASIDLARSDVYITNTVKYRPPDNRDPLPREKADCYQWLAEELNCIQPKIIVPLGRHALNTFFPQEKISEVHGTVLEKSITLELTDGSCVPLSTTHIVPLYHPAAALNNGSLRQTLFDDFKKIPRILMNLKNKQK